MASLSFLSVRVTFFANPFTSLRMLEGDRLIVLSHTPKPIPSLSREEGYLYFSILPPFYRRYTSVRFFSYIVFKFPYSFKMDA